MTEQFLERVMLVGYEKSYDLTTLDYFLCAYEVYKKQSTMKYSAKVLYRVIF